MIDPRLYDKTGMIADSGDTVGTTCQYAMAYDDFDLFFKISEYLIWYKNNKLIFYRSYDHFLSDKNDMSRDHVLWYKIGQKYFNSEYCDNWYFKSLKPFGRISDKHKMTPDLWLFCRNYNFLWQLTLLLYLPFVTLITKLIHAIWLPQTTPDKFLAKERIHKYGHYENNKPVIEFYAVASEELNYYNDDLGRINKFKELWDVKKFIKNTNWSFFEYLFAEVWTWATYRPYTLYQTAFALWVSKNIPVITWILKRCLRWMSWRENPIVTLLTK